MSFTSNAVLLGCTLLLILICFGPIFLLKYQNNFTFDYFMIGILCYIINRGFILPFISVGLNTLVQNSEFITNLVLLSLGCVFIKLFVYKTFIKDKEHKAAFISAGTGEATAEIVLSIFPVFMNALSFSAAINSGSLADVLMNTYTLEETNQIIGSFMNTPPTYYLCLLYSSLILLFIHVTTAKLIQKKISLLLIIGFCLGMFTINYIASVSVLFYTLFFIICTILYFKSK